MLCRYCRIKNGLWRITAALRRHIELFDTLITYVTQRDQDEHPSSHLGYIGEQRHLHYLHTSEKHYPPSKSGKKAFSYTT